MDRNRYGAYKALLAVEEEDSWSNMAVASVLSQEGSKISRPAFLRELVYGVVENRIYLDYLLGKMVKKGLSGTDIRTLTILRMGLFQILFMDSVPDHAAVSTSVDLARKCAAGRERFVNGVLRGFLRERDGISLPDPDEGLTEFLSVRWSCHPTLADFLTETFGREGAEEFLRHANSPAVTGIRVDLSKISLEEAERALSAEGTETVRSSLSPRVLLAKGGNVTDTDLYRNGSISIQSEGSCWIADTAGPEPGDMVMDMCAAPGGKTLAMAEKMAGQGSIAAFDKYPHRAALIKAGALRTGLEDMISVSAADGTLFMEEYSGKADLVLLDVPCSGLGVIRSKPEIKLRPFDPKVPGLAEIQRDLLSTCSRYVRSGGRLVYSTCTVNPEENGKRVREFLKEHDGFEMTYERTILPQTDDSDGFYVSVMVRKDLPAEPVY